MRRPSKHTLQNSRAPTCRIEVANGVDTLIQNQYLTNNNTPVDHIIKNDEEDTIIQLDENDAVMIVLPYFISSQCQTTKDIQGPSWE